VPAGAPSATPALPPPSAATPFGITPLPASAGPRVGPRSRPSPPVGRYQAVSHNGQLVLLDTTNGECLMLQGNSWSRLAPPVNQPQRPVDAATAPPVDAGAARPAGFAPPDGR
jgi:hypothetical protein